MPPAPAHKSVSFTPPCRHCRPYDQRYYSDPGRESPQPPNKNRSDSTDSDLKYYSEPDANNYFEIDYEFLKELRRIARNNCPKCRRKRSRKTDKDRRSRSENRSQAKHKQAKPRNVRMKENYVYCNGRYHSDKEHCQLCCRICNRSTDTLDSIDDDFSLASKSYTSSKTTLSRSKETQEKKPRERKNSIQSNKSVSFLDSSAEEKDEPNYTAKSFTNDLKRFLLRPSTPRLSFRDKFMISFKQELEARKKSPKLKAIKGLWKSY